MTPRAKAIFFDLGETLVTQNIEDNMVTRNALQELSTILTKPVSTEKLFQIYKQGYRVNETMRSQHHVEIPIQVWMLQLLRRALGGEPSSQLVNKAIKIVVSARTANAVAFDDAHKVVRNLSKRPVKLGIISNVSSHEVALGILKRVRLSRYFDRVVTSAFTGIRKPDPGIFLYALMQLGIRPEQAVHVGDSERHDIEGGYAAGLRTVLVRRNTEPQKTLANFHFKSLAEASDTLQSL